MIVVTNAISELRSRGCESFDFSLAHHQASLWIILDAVFEKMYLS